MLVSDVVFNPPERACWRRPGRGPPTLDGLSMLVYQAIGFEMWTGGAPEAVMKRALAEALSVSGVLVPRRFPQTTKTRNQPLFFERVGAGAAARPRASCRATTVRRARRQQDTRRQPEQPADSHHRQQRVSDQRPGGAAAVADGVDDPQDAPPVVLPGIIADKGHHLRLQDAGGDGAEHDRRHHDDAPAPCCQRHRSDAQHQREDDQPPAVAGQVAEPAGQRRGEQASAWLPAAIAPVKVDR